MNDTFVYVFSDHDRDVLLTFGFYMVYSNERSKVFIFVNNEDAQYALNGMKYLRSCKLLFQEKGEGGGSVG